MNITMNVIYISLANIPTFFAEKVVCVSEQAEGLYSGLAYLLASTVSSIPVAAVSILAGTLIHYLITGPDPVYYRWYLFPEVRHGVRATRHRRVRGPHDVRPSRRAGVLERLLALPRDR